MVTDGMDRHSPRRGGNLHCHRLVVDAHHVRLLGARLGPHHHSHGLPARHRSYRLGHRHHSSDRCPTTDTNIRPESVFGLHVFAYASKQLLVRSVLATRWRASSLENIRQSTRHRALENRDSSLPWETFPNILSHLFETSSSSCLSLLELSMWRHVFKMASWASIMVRPVASAVRTWSTRLGDRRLVRSSTL